MYMHSVGNNIRFSITSSFTTYGRTSCIGGGRGEGRERRVRKRGGYEERGGRVGRVRKRGEKRERILVYVKLNVFLVACNKTVTCTHHVL